MTFLKRFPEPAAIEAALRMLWLRAWADRAVLYGLSLQIWQAFVGPITVLLLAKFLTAETQGYYFLFGSILGFQVFLELGFSSTLIYICSHEWAHLQFDASGRVIGDSKALARLVSLGKLVFKWYAVASCVFVIAIGCGGYIFLNTSSGQDIQWEGPWLAVAGVTGLLFWSAPFIAMLEGCNQVRVTNQYRLVQAIITTFALWLILFLGGGLWALLASACTRLACNMYLFFVRYARLFEAFRRPFNGPAISWKNEVWPLQWRTALSQIASYFGGNLFTPVIFLYFGAIPAGQMGMTWSLIGMLQAAALLWITTRTSRYGMLIARKEYGELDKSFLPVCIASTVFFIVGGVAFLTGISLLNELEYSIANRFLPPFPTALLLMAVLFQSVAACLAIYLHAHKRMPLPVLLPPLLVNVLAGCTVWLSGRHFGVNGAACGYLGVMILFLYVQTVVWSSCRKKWHHAAPVNHLQTPL